MGERAQDKARKLVEGTHFHITKKKKAENEDEAVQNRSGFSLFSPPLLFFFSFCSFFLSLSLLSLAARLAIVELVTCLDVDLVQHALREGA